MLTVSVIPDCREMIKRNSWVEGWVVVGGWWMVVVGGWVVQGGLVEQHLSYFWTPPPHLSSPPA